MGKCFFHWCPSGGCGKRVVYVRGEGFQCMVCKKSFTKTELLNFKNGVSVQDLYDEAMKSELGDIVLDQKLKYVAYQNTYRKNHKGVKSGC